MPKHLPHGSLRANLAYNLRTLRITAGLSQEEVSEKSGLDQTFVSHIETGRRNVSLDSVEKLAKALAVPALELLMPIPEGGTKDDERPQKALKEARQALHGAEKRVPRRITRRA